MIFRNCTATGNTKSFCGRTIVDVDLSSFEGVDPLEWEQHTIVIDRQPGTWPGLDVAVHGGYHGVDSYGVGQIEAVTDDTMVLWVDVESLVSRESAVEMKMLRPLGHRIGP